MKIEMPAFDFHGLHVKLAADVRYRPMAHAAEGGAKPRLYL
jgi:hypothetical protein